jgi:hypothetical protein
VSLRKNYNYTYDVVSTNGARATFKDITGADLEYLEVLFLEEGKTLIPVTEKVELLQKLLVNGSCPTTWAISYVHSAFLIIFKEILEHEFITKQEWLRLLYAMQNQSFVGIAEMEKQPMNKFLAMRDVHIQAIQAIKNEAPALMAEPPE